MKHACFLAVCLVALPVFGTAAELVLTENGSALAPPSPATASGAYDLLTLIDGLPLDPDPSLDLVLHSGPECVQVGMNCLAPNEDVA